MEKSGPKIDIILTNDEAEVRRLVSAGYCPVECSINGHSIVDSLVMDHHEDRSHLEAVSVRAIRDQAGARAHDPRFVVVGACDADASFAIAALAGLMPQNKATLALGTTIGVFDTDPIGKNPLEMPYGDFLTAWWEQHESTRKNRTPEGAIAAVKDWEELSQSLASPTEAVKTRLQTARDGEMSRIETAKQDLAKATIENGVCLIPGSKVFGFNIWHGRVEAAPADSRHGWANPVVVIYNEVSKTAAVCCPNKKVAEELFGEGGLKNIFSRLPGSHWGGREQVGGSGRGQSMTFADAQAAQREVLKVLAERFPAATPGSPLTL